MDYSHVLDLLDQSGTALSTLRKQQISLKENIARERAGLATVLAGVSKDPFVEYDPADTFYRLSMSIARNHEDRISRDEDRQRELEAVIEPFESNLAELQDIVRTAIRLLREPPKRDPDPDILGHFGL